MVARGRARVSVHFVVDVDVVVVVVDVVVIIDDGVGSRRGVLRWRCSSSMMSIVAALDSISIDRISVSFNRHRYMKWQLTHELIPLIYFTRRQMLLIGALIRWLIIGVRGSVFCCSCCCCWSCYCSSVRIKLLIVNWSRDELIDGWWTELDQRFNWDLNATYRGDVELPAGRETDSNEQRPTGPSSGSILQSELTTPS